MEAPPPVVETTPAPVYTMPKIEPEIIKQWREDFKLRTEKIESDANQEVRLDLGLTFYWSFRFSFLIFCVKYWSESYRYLNW